MPTPPHDTGGNIHALPSAAALDPDELAEIMAERRRDGLRGLFFMLDQMPPGSSVECSGVAALLALAIGE